MADTIIDNINSIIRTKSELKSVLTENGQNPSDTFSEYPDMFRSAIAGAGADEETINSYISAYLSTYNFIDQDALSANSYITLQDIPGVDLSSYVTYDFLSSQSYLTSIPNTYPTYTAIENMAYITMADVSACGYVTANDIDMSGYLPTTGGTLSGNLVPLKSATYNLGSSSSRWKEIRTKSAYVDTAYLQATSYSSSIVPTENNTYTLGNASYYYAYTYTSNLNLGTHTIKNNSTQSFIININGNDRYAFGNTGFFPMATNRTLGQNTNSGKWQSTYSYNYYFGYNTAISSNSDYGVQLTVNGNKNYQWNMYQFTMTNNNYRNQCSLGTYESQWAYTYTTNLILNGTNIMDIIGDVETLLSNI